MDNLDDCVMLAMPQTRANFSTSVAILAAETITPMWEEVRMRRTTKYRNPAQPSPSSFIRSECRKSLFHVVCLMTTAPGEDDA